jgi:hypothetical protein
VDEALPAPVHETTLPAQVELTRLRLDDYSAVVAATSSLRATTCSRARTSTRATATTACGSSARLERWGGPRGRQAILVADHDFWGRMTTGQRMPFQMRVGTVPGNTVWMLAPVTQYTGLAQYADDDEIIFAFV